MSWSVEVPSLHQNLLIAKRYSVRGRCNACRRFARMASLRKDVPSACLTAEVSQPLATSPVMDHQHQSVRFDYNSPRMIRWRLAVPLGYLLEPSLN